MEKAQAKNDVSPDKRSIKEWEDLYKTLQECEREFESIGDTVGGVAGEIISTAGSIMTASLSMINGIVQLVNISATGIKGTATAAATAIQTVEKASVILTIISAAMSIAMQIVNLFNNDDKKQEEIEALQDRIDQLQWELDNADIVRLQENSGKAVERVKRALSETYKELLRNKIAVNDVAGLGDFCSATFQTTLNCFKRPLRNSPRRMQISLTRLTRLSGVKNTVTPKSSLKTSPSSNFLFKNKSETKRIRKTRIMARLMNGTEKLKNSVHKLSPSSTTW